MLGDSERAGRLHPLLEPHRDRWVEAPYTGLSLGPIPVYLGILERMLGRPDTARANFEEALRMSTESDAPPWVAESLWQSGRTLLAHPAAQGDEDRGCDLGIRARGMAADMGQGDLARRIARSGLAVD